MKARRQKSKKTAKNWSAEKRRSNTGDSGTGCLIVFLIALYFGFVTLNWRDNTAESLADAERQLKSLQTTLAESESKLDSLLNEIHSTENELGNLEVHKELLQEQVAQIQDVRTNLIDDISAIDNVLERGSEPTGFLKNILYGFIANMLWSLMLVICTCFITKRLMTRQNYSEDEQET